MYFYKVYYENINGKIQYPIDVNQLVKDGTI